MSKDKITEKFDASKYEEEEESGSKLARKFKESPFMVFGLVGCVGVVGYGAYMFKRRTIRPSIFLMQLRVAAQGTLVGMLMIGVTYSLYQRLTGTYKPEDGR